MRNPTRLCTFGVHSPNEGALNQSIMLNLDLANCVEIKKMFSVEIPHRGNFSVIGGRTYDTLTAKILFPDRCRLEYTLTSSFAIDLSTPFKFLDTFAQLHELSWTSAVKDTVIPGIDQYLNNAVWFVQSLVDHVHKDQIAETNNMCQSEIQRIRHLQITQRVKKPII